MHQESQATQCLKPFCLWTPMDPTLCRPPRSAAFHTLWPGEGEGCWEGGPWADPSDPLVSVVGAPGVCLTCSCPTLQPRPHFSYCGYTHLCSSCMHVWTPANTLSHAHTPVHTPGSPCTHADSAPPKGAPFHYLASLRGGAQYHPPLLTPGAPTLQLVRIRILVPASGHQLELLGAKSLRPKQ